MVIALRIGGKQLNTSNNSHMILRFLSVGNAEYARFNSNSYLGLNQPNPMYQLDVGGSANVANNLYVGGSVNSAGNITCGQSANQFVMIRSNGSEHSNDKVGYYQYGTQTGNILDFAGMQIYISSNNADNPNTYSNHAHLQFFNWGVNIANSRENMRLRSDGTLILYNSGLNTCNNNINAGTGVITGQLAWSNITSKPTFLTDGATLSNLVLSNLSVMSFSNTGAQYLNKNPLYLDDGNKGLVYASSTNFGIGQNDGPVLYGWNGGILATMNSTTNTPRYGNLTGTLFWTSSSVGIGKSNPSYNLDVVGTANVSTTLTSVTHSNTGNVSVSGSTFLNSKPFSDW